jgi:hypothetical protein
MVVTAPLAPNSLNPVSPSVWPLHAHTGNHPFLRGRNGRVPGCFGTGVGLKLIVLDAHSWVRRRRRRRGSVGLRHVTAENAMPRRGGSGIADLNGRPPVWGYSGPGASLGSGPPCPLVRGGQHQGWAIGKVVILQRGQPSSQCTSVLRGCPDTRPHWRSTPGAAIGWRGVRRMVVPCSKPGSYGGRSKQGVGITGRREELEP